MLSLHFSRRTLFFIFSLIILFIGLKFTAQRSVSQLPLIAIASYGPHASLEATIAGIKDGLAQQGYQEGKQIRFEESHVNFEPSLIRQMLEKLKASRPTLMVALTTPVAQAAKNSFSSLPIVFASITDPEEAGLLTNATNHLITGASDRQDLELFLDFAKILLPNARTIGIFYATSEANDKALLKMMEKAVAAKQMQLVAVPIEQSRDIALRMNSLKGKVDLLYVGQSGPVQSALPAIVAEAELLKLPIFVADEGAVRSHYVLGCYGVSYHKVGENAAQLIKAILEGVSPSSLAVRYPSFSDHHGFISRKRANALGISLQENLPNTTIVE